MRNTIRDIMKMRQDGVPIPVLTCYDYTSAKILDSAGVPVLLVGDSLGMVVHGHSSTLPVTLEMMLLHGAAVARGGCTALIVFDWLCASQSCECLGLTLHVDVSSVPMFGR